MGKTIQQRVQTLYGTAWVVIHPLMTVWCLQLTRTYNNTIYYFTYVPSVCDIVTSFKKTLQHCNRSFKLSEVCSNVCWKCVLSIQKPNDLTEFLSQSFSSYAISIHFSIISWDHWLNVESHIWVWKVKLPYYLKKKNDIKRKCPCMYFQNIIWTVTKRSNQA